MIVEIITSQIMTVSERIVRAQTVESSYRLHTNVETFSRITTLNAYLRLFLSSVRSCPLTTMIALHEDCAVSIDETRETKTFIENSSKYVNDDQLTAVGILSCPTEELSGSDSRSYVPILPRITTWMMTVVRFSDELNDQTAFGQKFEKRYR